MSVKKPSIHLIAAACIVIVGLLLAWQRLNEFPSYIHAWAQSDWYSLSIGFHNNGFDFFHPETLIYNKQFPDWWLVDTGSTITSVDFPIHAYIVALLMKIFGTTAPWVFRVWTLVCSLVGIWFLYLLARRLTKNTLKSLAVVVIALTSPLYAYYFNSFLPSTPAISLVIIGLWAYVRYIQESETRFWHLAVAMLGVATLVRTSQAVALVAVCGFELLRQTKSNDIIFSFKNYLKKVQKLSLSVIVTLLVIIGYMLWNAHLRAQNGSLFLNYLMPVRNWQDVRDLAENINELWKFRYFSQLQHWVVLILVVAGIAFFIIRKKKLHRNSLFWFSTIYLFGTFLFFLAMFRQYNQHDYYFLDSFFTPILICVILALRQLPDPERRWSAAASLVLVVAGVFMLSTAKKGLTAMHYDPDRAKVCAENYAGSDVWLDEMGIANDAKILSMFGYPQNSPFILMHRKGYTMMKDDDTLVDSVVNFNYDYMVIENNILDEKYEKMKDVFSRFERIGSNGRLSIYKKISNQNF